VVWKGEENKPDAKKNLPKKDEKPTKDGTLGVEEKMIPDREDRRVDGER